MFLLRPLTALNYGDVDRRQASASRLIVQRPVTPPTMSGWTPRGPFHLPHHSFPNPSNVFFFFFIQYSELKYWQKNDFVCLLHHSGASNTHIDTRAHAQIPQGKIKLSWTQSKRCWRYRGQPDIFCLSISSLSFPDWSLIPGTFSFAIPELWTHRINSIDDEAVKRVV